MAGLDPAIHDFPANRSRTWMTGSSPVMTMGREHWFFFSESAALDRASESQARE